MENSDREQQVWQRVRSCAPEPPQNDLRDLQREALELAAAYRSLMGRLTGTAQEQAARLYRGERQNAAALAGLGRLARQGGEQLKLWRPGKEEPGKVLQRCYHRTRRCLTEYQARSAEGEFGVVFDQLAKRAGQHCALIAELLGCLT